MTNPRNRNHRSRSKPRSNPRPNPGRPPEIHIFFFFNGRMRRMTLRSHHVRDGSPLWSMLRPFVAWGYQIGVQFLNRPRRDRSDHRIRPADLSFLARGDVLLVVTRLPLDDERHEDRITVERGYNQLEVYIFECAERYFDVLARSLIRLNPELASLLPPAFESRANLDVRILKSAAWIKAARRLDSVKPVRFPRERRTPAFVMRCNQVASLNGADLVCVFGMGGRESQVWAHRVSTDYRHLLEKPGFTMVEMKPPPGYEPNEDEETTLDSAFEWEIEVVLHKDESEATV